MGRWVVRLRDRSNNTEQSRRRLWLVLCSCLSSEVDEAWDGVGCMWFGSLGIGVGWW